MLKRIMACLAVFIFLISVTAVSHASEVEVLMKMLLKKGMITQTDYNEVMNELKSGEGIEQRVKGPRGTIIWSNILFALCSLQAGESRVVGRLQNQSLKPL